MMFVCCLSGVFFVSDGVCLASTLCLSGVFLVYVWCLSSVCLISGWCLSLPVVVEVGNVGVIAFDDFLCYCSLSSVV